MAAVTIQSGAVVVSGSGNTGWSAKSLAPSRHAGPYLVFKQGNSLASLGDVSGNTRFAQSFTTGRAVDVTAISIPMGKNGSPTDDITVKLTTDAAGVPSGTVLGTSNPVNPSAKSGSLQDYLFTFAAPVSLSAGAVYWLTVERAGAVDGVNYCFARKQTTNIYAGGTMATYNGTTWTAAATDDLCCSIIGTIATSEPLYQITQDTSGTPKLHAWKSSDGGATWMEQDAAHAPAVFSSARPWSASDTLWGEIAVVYFSTTSAIRARVFDCTTDLWATTDIANAQIQNGVEPTSPLRMIYRTPGTAVVSFTTSADKADISMRYRLNGNGFWSITSVMDVTIGERSIVAEMATDKLGANGQNVYSFLYDAANDDFSLRSSASYSTESLSTLVDIDASAAASEAGHAPASYQVYSVSNVDTVTAVYIAGDDSLWERVVTLEAPSASAPLGTARQISASTAYAGRQVASCRYGADRYCFASTGTGIDAFVDIGDTGTWSSAINWKTGLTSGGLAQVVAIDGVGLLVAYQDGSDVLTDWAIGGVAQRIGGMLRTTSPAPLGVARTGPGVALTVTRSGPGTPLDVTRTGSNAPLALARTEGDL